MASIYQRGNKKVWYAKYYAGGRQILRCLKTTNRRIAEIDRRRVESALETNTLEVPSRTPLTTFLPEYMQWLEANKTHHSFLKDASYLKMFFDSYRIRNLQDITPGMIQQFITRRQRRDGIAPKTANRHREVLHRLFSYALKFSSYRSPLPGNANPVSAVERVPEPAPEIRFLDLDHIRKQLDGLAGHPQFQAMVATAIYAGLRRAEILWLTVDDVDLDGTPPLLRIRPKPPKTVPGSPKHAEIEQYRLVPHSGPTCRRNGHGCRAM